jgi:phage shock protein A
MTSLFKRLNDVVSANLNDLLDRVEDPERMIKQIIREMEESIGNAKEGVIDALASEKRLNKELESHREQSSTWRLRAEKALQANNESLAREALSRKKEHGQIAESLEKSWESARRTTERLKSQLKSLELKLDEARRKKGGLIARKRMVKARDQMDQTLESMDSMRDMETSFGRMEDRVLDMEARIEAREEIHDNHSELEREFLELEVDTEVEAELEALKKELSGESRA